MHGSVLHLEHEGISLKLFRVKMSVLGKGDEEGLRHVERDVLIPKKMKAKAMKLCEKYVKGTRAKIDAFSTNSDEAMA